MKLAPPATLEQIGTELVDAARHLTRAAAIAERLGEYETMLEFESAVETIGTQVVSMHDQICAQIPARLR